MKRFLGLLVGVTLAASFAGCGSKTTTVTGDMGGACGAAGQACCANQACGAGLQCMNNVCTAVANCGKLGENCCAGNTCTDANTTCTNGTCVAANPGAPTGDPCAAHKDCANGPLSTQKGKCILQLGMGMDVIKFEGGYCTSPCRASKTDPTNGVNSDCPGDNGTCEDGTNECRLLCQSSQDCRQPDYSCFVVNNIAPLGCLPTLFSDCDPSKAGTCPRTCPADDGGTPPDGGTPCFNQTCVNTGDGTVGACTPGCDPFLNIGCPGTANDSDCHASDVTAEGLCTSGADPGVGIGSMCGNFYSDCPGGMGCFDSELQKDAPGSMVDVCQRYCNAANESTQCDVAGGGKCVAYKLRAGGLVDPVNKTGICSKSKP